MDRHCIMAAVLFGLSDFLALIGFFTVLSNRSARQTPSSLETLYSLEPTNIQENWDFQIQHNNLSTAYEIINAFAWFVFAIPSKCVFVLFCSTYYR
jgi:hypothetical protein